MWAVHNPNRERTAMQLGARDLSWGAHNREGTTFSRAVKHVLVRRALAPDVLAFPPHSARI